MTEVGRWFVYLLSDGSRTYVGATTDVVRRIRQHNGHIRGGARATRGRNWFLVGCIGGIENRSRAYSLERRIKHGARGLHRRWKLLKEVGEEYGCTQEIL